MGKDGIILIWGGEGGLGMGGEISWRDDGQVQETVEGEDKHQAEN